MSLGICLILWSHFCLPKNNQNPTESHINPIISNSIDFSWLNRKNKKETQMLSSLGAPPPALAGHISEELPSDKTSDASWWLRTTRDDHCVAVTQLTQLTQCNPDATLIQWMHPISFRACIHFLGSLPAPRARVAKSTASGKSWHHHSSWMLLDALGCSWMLLAWLSWLCHFDAPWTLGFA